MKHDKPKWVLIDGVHKYRCSLAVYAWLTLQKNGKCKWTIALNYKYGTIEGKSESLDKAKRFTKKIVNTTKTAMYKQAGMK